MTITLADLLTVQTQQEAFDAMIAVLKSTGFPTTGWGTTGVPRRLLWAFASMQAKAQGWIYDIASGVILSLSSGNWLTLIMDNWYQETRTEAAFTVGTFSIGDIAAAGPFTISPNQLWWATDAGLRFYNTTGGTLALNGTLSLTIQAESSGAQYNVAEGAVTQLLTPLPGVGFAVHTPVVSDGTVPPVLTVSGTPASEYDFDIEITTGGALGAALFRWRVNGGA
ncbi:MAG: baseplate J/gp47 family protein, partial [Syntrophorhabdaceae bacterium]|nr:baseplate J/gp47 family protein [Syntrophorhabdaceae bacterium]